MDSFLNRLFKKYKSDKYQHKYSEVYENFISIIRGRNKEFKEGLKLAQKKNTDKLKLFKKLYKEYLK